MVRGDVEKRHVCAPAQRLCALFQAGMGIFG